MQSQEAMGTLGGVSKRGQQNYEAGERLPDISYLQNLYGHFKQLQSPIDLVYLVTGETSESSELSQDERALIEAYRKAPAVGKEFIRQASGMAANVTAYNPVAPAPSDDVTIDLVADYRPNREAARAAVAPSPEAAPVKPRVKKNTPAEDNESKNDWVVPQPKIKTDSKKRA
ncbi:hypothetical protein CKO18_07470 [Rhodoferax fermentans]|uniref:HTH cro/C1-type domain-containing protein n=2 Tax=Rhodoferax fermentans TaxID=28066 RepID=A0A1T1ANY0_RHOFE|nr:hypothetical protein [Rhodoferax fermentans]OOV05836.1 hypothetical protein RF819_03130 [Rhodoferax fermentans]